MTTDDSHETRAVVLAVLMTLAVVAGAAAVGGTAAAADTMVVDASGDEGNYTTIQSALDDADQGDTIEVRPGDYEESIRISTADVTVVADGGANITPAEGDIGTSGRIVDVRADGVTVEGFSVKGLGTETDDPVGIYTSGANANVANNSVENVLTGVQTSAAGSDGTSVEENDVSDVGVGISVQGNETTVDGNTISGAEVEGIGLIAGGTDDYTVRSGNSVTGNDVSTIDDAPSVSFYFGSPSGLNDLSNDAEYEVVNDLIDANTGIDAVAIKTSGETYDGAIENTDTGAVYVTIQDAVDAASPGDEIHLESGSYDGFVVDENVTVSGDDDVLIEGQVDVRGDSATLRGLTWNDSYTGNGPLLNVSGEDVHLEGIELDEVPTNHGTSIDIRGDDVTLTESTLTRSGDEGYALVHLYEGPNSVQATGAPTGVEITDNEIRGGDLGVFLESDGSVTIEGNDITPASGDDDAIWVTGVGYEKLPSSASVAIEDNGELVAVNNAPSGNLHYMTSLPAAFESDQSPITEGSTVSVPDGTYTLTERVDIPADGVTVEGESKDGVVIDGSGVGWPIYAQNKSDLTLRNLTVYGTQEEDTDDAVKLAFIDGLTVENVAVNGSTGNEFDLNNVRDATLRNLEADGEDTGGVGVALTAVRNATLENVDTQNNSWGGVGMYDASDDVQDNHPEGWDLMRNVSNVTIDESSDLGEPNSLYSDQEYGGTLEGFSAPAYQYAVENPDHRERGDDFVFYFESEQDAVAYARALDENASSTVRSLDRDENGAVELGSTFIVEDGMSIQTAIDAADAGDTIEVREGTYAGDVTVDKPITIDGAGTDATVIDTDGGSHAISVSASNVTIRDLNATNGNTGIDVPRTAAVSDFRLENVVLSQNQFGVYVHGDTVNTGDTDNGEFDGVHFQNVHIVDSERKGMYIEKLSNATFDGVVVDGVTSDSYGFNNGIDINLKDGDYRNVTIENSVVRNVAAGTPYDGTDSFSAAIAVKARDDGSYGDLPGTLQGVTVDNVTVEDSFNGLRFGEPGTTNEQPTNVTVRNSDFRNNTGYHVSVETESLALGDVFGENATNSFGKQIVVSDSEAIEPENLKNGVWANIGDAVAAAEDGDYVYVGSGTYEENVVIDSSITLQGAGPGETVIAPESGNPVSVANSTENDYAKIDQVSVRGLTVDSPESSSIGLIAISNADGDNETGNLTVENVVAEGGHAAFGLFDTEQATFHNVTARDVESEVGAFEVGGVGDLTITDSRIENASTGVLFNDFTGIGYQETGSLTVHDTTFAETDVGVNVTSGVDADDVVLQRNDFDTEGQSDADAVAVANHGSGTVNATVNYWGTSNGPSTDSNAYNDGSNGAGLVGAVDYTPWLNDSFSSGSTVEVVEPVVNTETNESYASVQAAVDDAASGETVLVREGTYDEDVQITTDNVTLAGAEGATLTGQVGFGQSYADNVSIYGFAFTGDVNGSIQANGAGDNLTVVDNTFDGPSAAVITGGEDTGYDELQTGWVVAQNHVAEAGVDHDRAAFQLWTVDDVTVVNNTVENTDRAGVSLRWVETAYVADNTFEDTQRAGVFVTSFGKQNAGLPASEIVVANNTFVDAGDPADTYTQAAVLVDGSVENRSAIFVHENRISEFRTHGVWVLDGESVTATGEVNAAENYWGAPTGPSGEGPGAGANVSENVTYAPFYTDDALSSLSTEPPQVSDVSLTDVTDGNGVVADGDTLRVSARVVDPSGVDSVVVDAQPFGGNETLALTDDNGDDVYETEFDVDAAAATSPDGSWSLSVTATDVGGANASASTDAVALATDSETTTTYEVSDTTPLTSDVVSVDVSVENVGNRSAERTVSLVVDGEAVDTRTVTVAEGATRTVTFDRKFDAGEQTVTVNDSETTLAETTVTGVRPTNPDADVEVTSPAAGDAFADDSVVVEFDLTDADTGIANVTYAVDDGDATSVSPSASNVTLTELADGEHTVTVGLVDNLDNTVAEDTVTFAVDSSPPVVSIDPARDGNVSANDSVDVDLTATDDNPDDATFEVRNESGPVYTEDVGDALADGTETLTWDGTRDDGTPVATGEYDLVLNATDAGGLSNETTATVAVDNTPPTVDAITPDATDLGGEDSVTVTVDADDANSTVENVSVTLVAEDVNYRTTAEATKSGSGWVATFDAANLSVDGSYDVTATATDAANNEGADTNESALDADTTAPSVSATVDTKNATHGSVNVSVSEDVAGADDIELDLSAGDGSVDVFAFEEVGDSGTYSGTFELVDGSTAYVLEANATDDAGNTGTSSATANISTLPDAETHRISSDDGTVVELTMNQSAGGVAAFTSSDSPLAELGTNVGSTFLNGELNESLEANLANATIRIPVEGNEVSGVPNDEVNISRYNETDGAWNSLPTTVETVDGTGFFVTTVEGFSTYGPVNPDDTKPTIEGTSLSPDDGDASYDYDTDEVEVSVEYDDNDEIDASNVSVAWDNGTKSGMDVTDSAETSISDTEATFTATDLVGSGDHTVTVTAVDAAGNENSTEVAFTVAKDDTAPAVRWSRDFDETYAYGTDSVTADLDLTDDQSGVNASSVVVKYDGEDVTEEAVVTESGIQYEVRDPSPGTHDVTVSVADNEGNEPKKPVTKSFTVESDTDAPSVTDDSVSPTPDAGVLPLGTSQATFSLSYEDATSSVDASAIEVSFDGDDVTDEAVVTSSGLEYTAVGLENGTSYTLSVDVVDEEGNEVTETVTVDVAAPPSDDDGGADGGDSSDRSDSVDDVQTSTRVSSSITGGQAHLDTAGTVSELGVYFEEGGTGGTVSAQALDERPESVPSIPDATGITYVDVTVPEERSDAAATLEFTVDADDVGETDPSDLVVYHYTDGEWSALETEVASTSDGEIEVEATTPGFSLFAVGSEDASSDDTQDDGQDGAQDDTQDDGQDDTQDDTQDDGQDDEPADTPADAQSTDEPVEEPAGIDFGALSVLLLVIVVLLTGYVVWRRST